MHGKLGELYLSSGTKRDMEKGRAHVQKALEISASHVGETDHIAAGAMATLGQVLLTEGQYKQVRGAG